MPSFCTDWGAYCSNVPGVGNGLFKVFMVMMASCNHDNKHGVPTVIRVVAPSGELPTKAGIRQHAA